MVFCYLSHRQSSVSRLRAPLGFSVGIVRRLSYDKYCLPEKADDYELFHKIFRLPDALIFRRFRSQLKKKTNLYRYLRRYPTALPYVFSIYNLEFGLEYPLRKVYCLWSLKMRLFKNNVTLDNFRRCNVVLESVLQCEMPSQN